MTIKKILFTLFLGTILLISNHLTVMAISDAELPWDWFNISSNGSELSLGLGTRDPNLGDNFGLELNASCINKQIIPEINLLYFFDLFNSISLNAGLGVAAKKAGTGTEYEITYSGGAWFPIGDSVLGLGFNSYRGVSIRYSWWF